MRYPVLTLTVAQRAKQAHEDFSAIVRGINTLAVRLEGRCICVVPAATGAESAALDAPFMARLADAYTRAGQWLLSKLQSQGATQAATFSDYLAGLPAPIRREQQATLTIRAWHLLKGELLEALALLAVLDSRDILPPPPQIPLFCRLGPIAAVDAGSTTYVWTQQTTTGNSGLRARPDILVTSSPTLQPNTILSIQECKHKKMISSHDLRSEFGKAHDLNVAAYTVVAYRKVPKRLHSAATTLGIEIMELGLEGPQRAEYVSGTKDLGAELSIKIRDAEKRSSFAKEMRRSADESERKMVTLR
jgi:hypothetical protein